MTAAKSKASQAVQSKQASKDGWQPMGHVSQTHPKGRNAQYVNAAFNCGPSVVAMLARGHGKLAKLSDAQLINRLGRGVVTEQGSTPRGIAKMLEKANVPIAGPALGGPYDNAAVKGELKKGRMLIAQVKVEDPKTKEKSSHYVLVRKMTADGNFVISDPLKKGTSIVTPQQLAKAVNGAPPDGGMLIPVSRPGGDLKPKEPAPPPAQPGLVDHRSFQYPPGWAEYVRNNPFTHRYGDMGPNFDGERQWERRGADSFQPSSHFRNSTYGGSDFRRPGRDRMGLSSMQDRFMGSSAAGARPAPSPAPAEKKPPTKTKADKNAFTATDDVYTGVKTDFVAQPAAPEPAGKSSSKNKAFRLIVSYKHHDKDGAKADKPVLKKIKTDEDVQAAAERLLKLKAKGTKGINKILGRMENSPHESDKLVLSRLKNLELNQGGIGKKINYESWG
ncbi:hypothetical protein HG543_15260 [Pyxidicoccus fallax]|uniref:Peptidase C39 domain-containing protein n=2 Tax=Pyxidicoccus fallax TaxID=394095 RepID=A0A848LHN6_9BACT|nr:hypothetical protein [Pyxidicoccus fallax]